MTRKTVDANLGLPDILKGAGALPHTGAAVPDPDAPQGSAVKTRPRAGRAAVRANKPLPPRTIELVAPVPPGAIATVLGGPITRVDVQVPVGISNWLRSSTRPEHTGLTRSLGARTPASSLLTAAVELLAERGMDLSRLDSSEPEAVTAAFRAALQAAAKS